jgi:hypothetical protein
VSLPSRPQVRWRTVLRIAGLAVLLGVVVGVARLASARHNLVAARSQLSAGKMALGEGRAADARASFAAAARSLGAARGAAGLPLSLVGPIPVVGSPGRAVVDTAGAGLHVATAGRLLADAADALPTSGHKGVDGHDLTSLHAAVAAAAPSFTRAGTELRLAAQDLRGPAHAFLAPVSSPARQVQGVVTEAQRYLARAQETAGLLADLTAPTTDARILLLSQDTLELRPTGGYIGSMGVLHFDHGTVALEGYQSYEELAFPTPPMPAPANLAKWLDGDDWDLSNVNWQPDFPTVAATAKEMYKRSGGGDVDGVVAITERLLIPLLEVVGPVQVPGYSQPVVAQGLEDRILYEVELKRPLDTPRKKFITELSHQMMDRLFRAEPAQVPKIASVMGQAAGTGDAQAWFAAPARQKAVAGTVWAGALPKASRDFLMLVDANMWASKANRDLVRTVNYTVRDEGGQYVAHLRATFENKGAKTELNPTYQGYLRVYVPKGAKLLKPDATHVDEGLAPDGPYRVFSTVVRADPKTSVNVDFTYVLPESVAPGGDYALMWPRQAGTPNDVLNASAGGRSVVGDASVRQLRLAVHIGPTGLRGYLHSRWLFRKLGL